MRHRTRVLAAACLAALVSAGCAAGPARPTTGTTPPGTGPAPGRSAPLTGGAASSPQRDPGAEPSLGPGADPSSGPLIGAGCARYADPATARRVAGRSVLDVIRDDPRLTWSASALTGGVLRDVDYTQTLAGGQFTVFAPTDDAVGLPVDARTDPAVLRFDLDFHIVPGRAMSPQQLLAAADATDSGTVQTLQGWGLALFLQRGSSDAADLRVSEDAVVPVCGNIPTANARLYLVPALLHPAGDYTVPGAGGPGAGGPDAEG